MSDPDHHSVLPDPFAYAHQPATISYTYTASSYTIPDSQWPRSHLRDLAAHPTKAGHLGRTY